MYIRFLEMPNDSIHGMQSLGSWNYDQFNREDIYDQGSAYPDQVKAVEIAVRGYKHLGLQGKRVGYGYHDDSNRVVFMCMIAENGVPNEPTAQE